MATKKTVLFILIVASGFGLLLLSGCKDHLSLVKQEMAETNQQPLNVASNYDSAPEAVNTTVTTSSTVTADNPEFNSVSTDKTGPDYQATDYQAITYQASALPSPFRVANFIDPSIQSIPIKDQFRDQSSWPDHKPDQLLSKFQYRGRMTGVNEPTYGLIQRPDGIIMRVKVGQGVGQESIQVLEITPTQINLVEQGVDTATGVTAKRLALIAPVAP